MAFKLIKLNGASLRDCLTLLPFELEKLGVTTGQPVSIKTAFEIIERAVPCCDAKKDFHDYYIGSFGVVLNVGEKFAEIMVRDANGNYALCVVESE